MYQMTSMKTFFDVFLFILMVITTNNLQQSSVVEAHFVPLSAPCWNSSCLMEALRNGASPSDSHHLLVTVPFDVAIANSTCSISECSEENVVLLGTTSSIPDFNTLYLNRNATSSLCCAAIHFGYSTPITTFYSNVYAMDVVTVMTSLLPFRLQTNWARWYNVTMPVANPLEAEDLNTFTPVFSFGIKSAPQTTEYRMTGLPALFVIGPAVGFPFETDGSFNISWDYHSFVQVRFTVECREDVNLNNNANITYQVKTSAHSTWLYNVTFQCNQTRIVPGGYFLNSTMVLLFTPLETAADRTVYESLIQRVVVLLQPWDGDGTIEVFNETTDRPMIASGIAPVPPYTPTDGTFTNHPLLLNCVCQPPFRIVLEFLQVVIQVVDPSRLEGEASMTISIIQSRVTGNVVPYFLQFGLSSNMSSSNQLELLAPPITSLYSDFGLLVTTQGVPNAARLAVRLNVSALCDGATACEVPTPVTTELHPITGVEWMHAELQLGNTTSFTMVSIDQMKEQIWRYVGGRCAWVFSCPLAAGGIVFLYHSNQAEGVLINSNHAAIPSSAMNSAKQFTLGFARATENSKEALLVFDPSLTLQYSMFWPSSWEQTSQPPYQPKQVNATALNQSEVKYNVNYNLPVMGFNISSTCVRSLTCQATATPEPLVPLNATNAELWEVEFHLRSDYDGDGSFPSPGDENCSWTIRCPSAAIAPDNAVALEITSVTYSSDFLSSGAQVVVNGTALKDIISFPHLILLDVDIGSNRVVSAQYTGGSIASNSVGGFTVQLRCLKWTRTTFAPTFEPTAEPTYAPTFEPTPEPTTEPTWAPTFAPTFSPTFSPTSEPTTEPTYAPTLAPTPFPTEEPTFAPTTLAPTPEPTTPVPTESPTDSPTFEPTFAPTASPRPTLPPTTVAPPAAAAVAVANDVTTASAAIASSAAPDGVLQASRTASMAQLQSHCENINFLNKFIKAQRLEKVVVKINATHHASNTSNTTAGSLNNSKSSIASPTATSTPAEDEEEDTMLVMMALQERDKFDGPVSPFLSPTQLRLGPERGQYYRGAVFGNFAIMVWLGIFASLLASYFANAFSVIDKRSKTLKSFLSDWGEGYATIHCPGVLVIVAVLFLHGTLSSAITAAIHGNAEVWDQIALGGTLVFYAAVVLLILVRGALFSPSSKHFQYVVVPDHDERRRGTFLRRLWFPCAEWKPANPIEGTKLKAYGILYSNFRQPTRFCLAGDILLAVGAVVVGGTTPVTSNGCLLAKWLMVSINVLAFLLSLSRPFLCMHRNCAVMVVSLVTAVGSLVATLWPHNTDVPAVFFTLAQGVTLIGTLVAFAQRIQNLVEEGKQWLLERKAHQQQQPEQKLLGSSRKAEEGIELSFVNGGAVAVDDHDGDETSSGYISSEPDIATAASRDEYNGDPPKIIDNYPTEVIKKMAKKRRADIASAQVSVPVPETIAQVYHAQQAAKHLSKKRLERLKFIKDLRQRRKQSSIEDDFFDPDL